MTTTRILLTRHGLSEHNLRTDVYMGRSPDSRLVEEGRTQARALGARLRAEREDVKVDRIVASSLPRTMETAQLIAETMGIHAVEEEDDFWELSKGDWEGQMPRHDLPSEVAKALAEDPFGFRYPGGESYRDATERAAPALERWINALAGHRVLFVLHGDILRAVLRHMMGFPEAKVHDFVVHPCSLSELHHSGGVFQLAHFNDISHLR